MSWPFFLTVAGFLLAVLFYLWKPEWPVKMRQIFSLPVRILENKYGFDRVWIDGFAGCGVKLGKVSRAIDIHVVDGVLVNGSAHLIGLVARVLRRTQSGFVYHYAFAMIIGLIALLAVLMCFWR